MAFSGSGFGAGECVEVLIAASSAVVPANRTRDLIGRWTWYFDEDDQEWCDRDRGIIMADPNGATKIVYVVPAGWVFRDLSTSYGDDLLPITHTVTEVGDTTNRRAVAMYMQDVPTS